MAADFPDTNTLKYALGVNEFEDFEVTEVDGTILWDLLEELENEEKKSDNSELIGHEPNNMMTIAEVSLDKNEISIPDSNSNWVAMDDMMMETDPLHEIEGWFTDDMVGMVDFGYSVGDYSQLHNGVGASSTEITYNCLWEES
ncbi:hypothetical protein RchiOBHm_Chr2g0152101 [Rosa chinensis]|uniref:Uncharacterized protein n=1 Tax=Rosa chinensis TaxID=74649 RepID=A0A2P6S0A9_ROSCH|nr:hypothetical protein RchiOBHm_Chr2g0152101 [Rosa chinensis]